MVTKTTGDAPKGNGNSDKLDLAGIDRNIGRVAQAGENFNNLVQATIIAIGLHAKEHGDVTRALKLVQAMPNSFRRTMAVNYMAYYFNIGMNVKKGDVKRIKPDSNRYRNVGDGGFDIDGARANPWYEDASVPGQQRDNIPDTLMEFEQKVLRLLDRQENYINDDDKFGDKSNPDRTAEMRKTALGLIDQLREVVTNKSFAIEAEYHENEAKRLRELDAKQTTAAAA